MEINNDLLNIYLKENQTNFKELMTDLFKNLKFTPQNFDKFTNVFVPSSCVLMANKYQKLPFSCYLLDVEDSMFGIMKAATLTAELSSLGGGIGCNLSNIREIGASVASKSGEASGVIAAARIFEPVIQFCTKNENRGGAICCYLDVDHPEIEDFISIREIGGSVEKRAHTIHHGVNLSDKFMRAVENKESFDLISRQTKEVVKTIDARTLFINIIKTRIETGEPFIVFIDTINKHMKKIGYINETDSVDISNLCTEVLVKTRTNGKSHVGICCLGSLNLLNIFENYYDDIEVDITKFFSLLYDNASKRIKKIKEKNVDLYNLLSSELEIAMKDRTFGVGVFNYALAVEKYKSEREVINILNIFYHKLKIVSKENNHALCSAIAPTTRISMLFNGTPCIEHFPNSDCMHQDGSRSYILGKNTTNRIIPYQLDVDNCDYMNRVKEILDCGIDQSISCNLYYDTSNPEKIDVGKICKDHIYAWKIGLRTLYYCKGKASGRGVEACSSCSN
ncbi:MAG: hypothetical protein ACRCX2_01165 [Paraclostridium sp.]